MIGLSAFPVQGFIFLLLSSNKIATWGGNMHKIEVTEGKTALGASSPAYPALQLYDPKSTTMADTSSVKSERKEEKINLHNNLSVKAEIIGNLIKFHF
jgi:hypothetical protein